MRSPFDSPSGPFPGGPPSEPSSAPPGIGPLDGPPEPLEEDIGTPETRFEENPLKPRIPTPDMEPEPETEVRVDAATGEVTISKGNTKIKVADVHIPGNSPWSGFMRGNPAETEDHEEYPDGHDNPYAAPANRRTPPQYEVSATVPEYMDARSLAFALRSTYGVDVETNENNLTVKDAQNPLSIVDELKVMGVDAEVSGDTPEFFPGMKVAVLKDLPEFRYLYDSMNPMVGTLRDFEKGSYYIDTYYGLLKLKEEDFTRV